jgi:hypothetical protein
MSEQQSDNVNRRGFLKALAATAGAAAVTGGGAAIWSQRSQLVGDGLQTAVSHSQTTTAQILPPVAGESEAAILRAQLAAAQAENARLQAALVAS